jgi:hypothetical protein
MMTSVVLKVHTNATAQPALFSVNFGWESESISSVILVLDRYCSKEPLSPESCPLYSNCEAFVANGHEKKRTNHFVTVTISPHRPPSKLDI